MESDEGVFGHDAFFDVSPLLLRISCLEVGSAQCSHCSQSRRPYLHTPHAARFLISSSLSLSLSSLRASLGVARASTQPAVPARVRLGSRVRLRLVALSRSRPRTRNGVPSAAAMLGNDYDEYYSKTHKPNSTPLERCRRVLRRNPVLSVALLFSVMLLVVLSGMNGQGVATDQTDASAAAAFAAAASPGGEGSGGARLVVPHYTDDESSSGPASQSGSEPETASDAMEQEARREREEAERAAEAERERLGAERDEAVAKAAELKERVARLEAGSNGGGGDNSKGGAAADGDNTTSMEARREAVKEEFLWAYRAYERDAWGKDELHPIKRTGDGGFDMGLTIVDSLDTMWVMGLREDFRKGVEWVRNEMRLGHQRDINLFETTIRIMGGLLAAHGLSGEAVLLERARELADLMIMAFDSPTGLPYGTLDLGRKRAYNPTWQSGASSVSEVGTLQLEWGYLSRLTGDPKYGEKADKVMEFFEEHPVPDGLYPLWINPDTGAQKSPVISFGSRADSIYEYFVKQWVVSRGRNKRAKRLYDASMDGMVRKLIRKSRPGGLTYIQELHSGAPSGKFDHLVCFVPGMLALGVQPGVGDGNADNPKRDEHMRLARELAETCYQFYKRSPTGLAPEIVQFQDGSDFVNDRGALHNLLRPETVESLFVMWRLTGDAKYREQGWEIFQAFRKHGRVASGGYSSLRSVENTGENNFKDKMESFFLGETLKYLYLLFSDNDVLPLDRYVFNTEAHPFPVEAQ